MTLKSKSETLTFQRLRHVSCSVRERGPRGGGEGRSKRNGRRWPVMSQKTGDSYAMPSISYPDETRRDIASNSLSLSLSPSRTSTRPRARVHDVYTTAVRRARARAHNSPRALARRPVLLAPRRNRGPLLTMIPSVPPRYTDGCSSRDEGGNGSKREERRGKHEKRTTDRGVEPRIEEWDKRRRKIREGKGVESGGKRGGVCIPTDIYLALLLLPLALPRSSANAHKCIPISGRIFPGGTSGRKERVIGTST